MYVPATLAYRRAAELALEAGDTLTSPLFALELRLSKIYEE